MDINVYYFLDRTRIPMAPSKPTVTEISAHSISLMWYPRGNGGSPIKWYRVSVVATTYILYTCDFSFTKKLCLIYAGAKSKNWK